MKSPFQQVVLTSNPFGIQKGVKRPSGICFVEQRKRYKVKPLGNSGVFCLLWWYEENSYNDMLCIFAMTLQICLNKFRDFRIFFALCLR
jgi:hypothetical protein